MRDRLDVALAEAETAAAAAADACVDPTPLIKRLAAHEARIAAVRTRLAGRSNDADGVARATGTTKRKAKASIDTAKRLDKLPVLRRAYEQGELSEPQAELAAKAAAADPTRQTELLGVAKTRDLAGLRRRCGEIIAGADTDEAATRARLHRQRRGRTWRDPDGAWCLSLRTTPEVGAAIKPHLDRAIDAVFTHARRQGHREPFDAYVADAIANLLTSTSEPTKTKPKAEVVIHVDLDAMRRGHTRSGETCEIVGVGPVAVEVVEEMAADAFIKAVIRCGTDIRTVAHFGRHVPEILRTALQARSRTCETDGCSRQGRLEVDHDLVDFAHGGPLSIDNAKWRCTPCHRNKTRRTRQRRQPRGPDP